VLNLDWKPPVLETPRLILRAVAADDAGDVFLYACNPTITRYTLWNTHETIDDTLVFVRDYAQSRYVEREPDPIAIILKSDPTHSVIGSVGCFWASKKDGVMELGYNLAEPYWGRGITAEAARRLVEFVFADYPVERIQARVIDGNAASARVAEKVGMMREGRHRALLLHRGRHVDVEFYSILRSEVVTPQGN
jgi:ribosomal-protein-alanine N-acetyltransferase